MQLLTAVSLCASDACNHHVGALPASGVTSLQVALSFSGDFLEFVFDMAIKYRFARGHNHRRL
jgi:hypothetical protein